jgi:hypothetical protein
LQCVLVDLRIALRMILLVDLSTSLRLQQMTM